jgi:hypothetical protein
LDMLATVYMHLGKINKAVFVENARLVSTEKVDIAPGFGHFIRNSTEGLACHCKVVTASAVLKRDAGRVATR